MPLEIIMHRHLSRINSADKVVCETTSRLLEGILLSLKVKVDQRQLLDFKDTNLLLTTDSGLFPAGTAPNAYKDDLRSVFWTVQLRRQLQVRNRLQVHNLQCQQQRRLWKLC